jgi:hypothetical protein
MLAPKTAAKVRSACLPLHRTARRVLKRVLRAVQVPRSRCASMVLAWCALACKPVAGASTLGFAPAQSGGRPARGVPHALHAAPPPPLAFSILCRTRFVRTAVLLRPKAGGGVSVARTTVRAASSGGDVAGAAGEETCSKWTEPVWAEQLNIRDLEKEQTSSSQFFRTSCVFAPNKPADLLDTLVAQRGVSVVLDLRSLDEMKTDVASSFETVIFSRSAPPSLAAATEAAAKGRLVRYVVPLLEREYILPSLRARLPIGRRLAFLWSGLTSAAREQEIMVEEINKIGLGGLNELMLDGCGPEICWALQLMATLRQVPSAAVAVQCRLGKDRTGLISALFKSSLGMSEREIIEDYTQSEGIDEIALGELQQRMEAAAAPGKPVLDRAIFSGADPANMVSTLAWIREKHGSTESYLDSIGFDTQWRQKLRGAA